MQNSILFFADSHLTENDEDKISTLSLFLSNNINSFSSIVFLGDIFDLWVGDYNSTFPAYKKFLALLDFLSQEKKKIYFTRGNRDFLFSAKHIKPIPNLLITKKTFIDTPAGLIRVEHGDNLCRHSIGDVVTRLVTRSWVAKLVLFLLPNKTVFQLGIKIKNLCSFFGKKKLQKKYGLSFRKLEKALSSASTLVCGHLHSPNKIEVGNKFVYVVGETFSESFNFLFYKNSSFNMINIPIAESKDYKI